MKPFDKLKKKKSRPTMDDESPKSSSGVLKFLLVIVVILGGAVGGFVYYTGATPENAAEKGRVLFEDMKVKSIDSFSGIKNFSIKQYESIRDSAMLMIDPEYKAPPSSVVEEKKSDTPKKQEAKHSKSKRAVESEIKILEKQIRDLRGKKNELIIKLNQ